MVSENVLICFDMCWYVLIKEGHVSCIPFRRDSNLKANLNNMFRTFCQSKPDKLDSEHKNIQMFKRFQALCNEGFLKALGERLSEFRSAIWYDKIWYIYIYIQQHILRRTVLGWVALSCPTRSITSAKSPALGRRLPLWFYHALWSDDPRWHVRSSPGSAQIKTAQGSVSGDEWWCALFIFKSTLPGMNWNHALENLSF